VSTTLATGTGSTENGIDVSGDAFVEEDGDEGEEREVD